MSTPRKGIGEEEVQLHSSITLAPDGSEWSTSRHGRCTYLVTHSKEQCPSLEANRFSASQEIPCILWNRIHKCPPPVTILSQINPAHVPHLTSSHLRVGLPYSLFLSGFPTKTLYALLLSSHTCYMPRPSDSFRFDHANNIGRTLPLYLPEITPVHSEQEAGWTFWGRDRCLGLPGFNPLNAELNPICHLLALLGGATIVVVSRLRVKYVRRIAGTVL